MRILLFTSSAWAPVIGSLLMTTVHREMKSWKPDGNVTICPTTSANGHGIHPGQVLARVHKYTYIEIKYPDPAIMQ